jgi:hypothetical protein
MEFNRKQVKYWKEEFKKYKHFDIVPYEQVIEDYIKVNTALKGNHETFGWNERPINSEVDELKQEANWQGYDPMYFNIDPVGEKVLMAKADVISMDMNGVGKDWSHFLYLELPSELINKYMTQMHDNSDISIARKFIKTVEATELGWDTDNWKVIEKEFDEEHPETSSYTDFYETHIVLKWKQDFDIHQYISLKKEGILFPICYNDKYSMLRRGTHRAVLLAMTDSDIPIFLQFPNTELNTKIKYTVTTPEFFDGGALEMEVDVENKKLEFKINSKYIGKL